MKKRKFIFRIILLVVLVGGGATAWYFWNRAKAIRSGEADKTALDRTYTVVRQDLTLGVILDGTLNAREKHKLSLQANYSTKLLWVIDENSKVKAGDLLATFETDSLVENIDKVRVDLDTREKEYNDAVEEERLLISQNEADLRSAEDAVTAALDALRKYQRFERSSKRDSLELAISTAENDLEEARSNLSTRRTEIMKSGAEDKDAEEANNKELASLQSKVDTAKNALDTAETNRKVFKRYDDPSQLKTLRNALDQAELNLEKVKVSNRSKINQNTRSRANLKNDINRIRRDLERYESYMELMTLKAPEDGIVIYGDPDNRWSDLQIQQGMDVHKGMVLMTIPEMSNLVIDFDLPEQYRSQVDVNNEIIISPDSLPGVKATGKIEKIATLPTTINFWDSSSPKIYKSRGVLTEQNPEFVNGMSVQLDIVTGVIKDTLFVPIEAVFEDKDRLYVYRMNGSVPEERDVKIGNSNTNFVEITEGLAEGDVVCLYKPYQKKQE